MLIFLNVQALGGGGGGGGSVPLAPTLSSWASVFGFIFGGNSCGPGNSLVTFKLIGGI